MKYKKNLPDKDHVVRYCKPSTIENNILVSSAFTLREELNNGKQEEYLSVDWMEFFNNNNYSENLLKIIDVLNERFTKPGKKNSGLRKNGGLAIFKVGEIKKASEEYNIILVVYQIKNSYSGMKPSSRLFMNEILLENVKDFYVIKNLI